MSNIGTEQNPRYEFSFSGNRYELASADLPHFYDWVKAKMGIEPLKKKEPQGEPNYPDPVVNEGTHFQQLTFRFSFDHVKMIMIVFCLCRLCQ